MASIALPMATPARTAPTETVAVASISDVAMPREPVIALRNPFQNPDFICEAPMVRTPTTYGRILPHPARLTNKLCCLACSLPVETALHYAAPVMLCVIPASDYLITPT